MSNGAPADKLRQAMLKNQQRMWTWYYKDFKKSKKREQDLEKDLFAQKRHYGESIKEMESFMRIMLQCYKGKIKSLK